MTDTSNRIHYEKSEVSGWRHSNPKREFTIDTMKRVTERGMSRPYVACDLGRDVGPQRRGMERWTLTAGAFPGHGHPCAAALTRLGRACAPRVGAGLRRSRSCALTACR